VKRIILITSHAPSLVYFRAPLIKTIVENDFDIYALAPNFDEQTRVAVRTLGAIPVDCPISRTGMNPLSDAINTWKMTRLLKRIKPDITLGYFIKPVIYGSIAARLAGVPRRFAMVEGLGFVFTPATNALSLKRRLLKHLVLLLYRLGLSCAHCVIFLNPDDRAELSAAGVVPSSKTFLLGGIGVDLDKWAVSPSVVSPVTFLLVARLLREKGVEEYATAARLVKQRYPGARFILLGGIDDNPGSITINDVQAWVDEGILEWHGHVAVQPWLKQTSVFVLPSYYREGVPASTQEAMAMGRAVITTDAPGCRETVVEGVNGFLVPSRNALALAEKMFTFIEQPTLIEFMGRESRRLAEERFDVHKVNQRLVDLILAPQPPSA
jgi:glycosyltransferase involved in cell wall biosynthesis